MMTIHLMAYDETVLLTLFNLICTYRAFNEVAQTIPTTIQVHDAYDPYVDLESSSSSTLFITRCKILVSPYQRSASLERY